MKFNLTNKPRYSSVGEPDDSILKIINEYNEWLEGFELELQERLKTIEYWSKDKNEGRNLLIKEILGDG